VLEGLDGALAGASGAVPEDSVEAIGVGLEVATALLDGGDLADDVVGEPAFALDAADAGGGAALPDFGDGFFSGEDLVEVADGADLGVAGVGAADAGGVCDHGFELGAEVGFGLGQHEGVAVTFAHFSAVEAGELGAGGEEDAGLGEDAFGDGVSGDFGPEDVLVGVGLFVFGVGLGDGGGLKGAVELVEAAGDLTGELNVGDLIGANGDEVGLVEEDVGGLEEGVAEKAEGVEVLFAELLLLVLVGGDALEPGEGGEHGEEGEELGVLGDVRLDEEGGALGVEAGGEEVEGDVADVFAEAGGVGVVGGEGVEIGDEEEAVVLGLAGVGEEILEADPVEEGAHVVAEVERAGRAHAGEDAGAGLVWDEVGHFGFVLMVNEWGMVQMMLRLALLDRAVIGREGDLFDRWTEAARQVVFVARFEAGRVGAEAIDTEDLLLGLARADPDLLRGVGAAMTHETIQAEANRWRPLMPSVPTSQDMPVSHDVELVFERAEAIAPAERCLFFRTEHLLLALAEVQGCHAATLVMEGEADFEAIQSRSERADCREQQTGDPSWMIPLLG